MLQKRQQSGKCHLEPVLSRGIQCVRFSLTNKVNYLRWRLVWSKGQYKYFPMTLYCVCFGGGSDINQRRVFSRKQVAGLRSSALLLVRVHLDQGFQPGAMARDILGCHDWEGGASGIQWVEARKAAKHPTMPTQAASLQRILGPGAVGHSRGVPPRTSVAPFLKKVIILREPGRFRAGPFFSFPFSLPG